MQADPKMVWVVEASSNVSFGMLTSRDASAGSPPRLLPSPLPSVPSPGPRRPRAPSRPSRACSPRPRCSSFFSPLTSSSWRWTPRMLAGERAGSPSNSESLTSSTCNTSRLPTRASQDQRSGQKCSSLQCGNNCEFYKTLIAALFSF